MECILEAHPMPEITWFCKDKPIKENNRISYECMKAKKHRYLLTLTIRNPTLQDGGMYRYKEKHSCLVIRGFDKSLVFQFSTGPFLSNELVRFLMLLSSR